MTLWFLGAQIIIAADTVQRVCMSRDGTNCAVMLIGEGYDPGTSLGEPTNSNDAVTKQHVDNYAENNPVAYLDTIPAQLKRAAISTSIYHAVTSGLTVTLILSLETCELISAFGNCGVLFDITQGTCLLYTSPSPRDISGSRMPSSA